MIYNCIWEGVKGGKVNWERLAKIRVEVLKWTHEEKPELKVAFASAKVYNSIIPVLLTDRRHDTSVMVNGEAERLTYDMKRNFLLKPLHH